MIFNTTYTTPRQGFGTTVLFIINIIIIIIIIIIQDDCVYDLAVYW